MMGIGTPRSQSSIPRPMIDLLLAADGMSAGDSSMGNRRRCSEPHRQDNIHAINRFAARGRGVFDVLWLLLIDTGDIVCSSV
jgi:hypothetical protein